MPGAPDPLQMDTRLAARLTAKHAQLAQYRPFSVELVRHLHADLRLLLTHHSTALEGNTLSLHETRLVLEEGLTVGDHPLREYLEATNHAAAFDLLTTLAGPATPLTLERLLELHRVTMGGLVADAGQLRTRAVAIQGALITIPLPAAVPALIADWLAWLAHEAGRHDPVTRATVAHHRFEAIHPFSDGNGRVGRLLLNLLLLQAGYPPALLLRQWRGAYLRALRGADVGYYGALLNLVGRAVEGALDLYLEAAATPPAADPYVPLAALAQRSGYSANYLGLLVRRGHIPAVRRGGRWYSTHTAVAQYQAEVREGLRPRGRPPQPQS
ncbi:MAG TPA: Fic family protein [Chloroflexia bacterium]|nr:Fic family protein [Chloroflexia bacterium]